MTLTGSKWLTVGDHEYLFDAGGSTLAMVFQHVGIWHAEIREGVKWRPVGYSPDPDFAKGAAERFLEARP